MIYHHKQNRKSIFFTEVKIIKFITTKNLFFNTESSNSGFVFGLGELYLRQRGDNGVHYLVYHNLNIF
jgi:hypothetical protein